MFRLLSAARVSDKQTKPETIVLAECSGIREREPYEKVHLRDFEHEGNPTCVVCSCPASVWFSYSTVDEWGPEVPPHKWMKHPARCC